MPANRFSSDVNRLRAALRGHTGDDLLDALRVAIEAIPAAVLVADNSARYVAANDAALALTGYAREQLTTMRVADLTPMSGVASGSALWETFIGQGSQRGDYELQQQRGSTVRVRYWAFASVAPGLHVSVLVAEAPPAVQA